MDREELVKNKTVEKDETGQGKQGRDFGIRNSRVEMERSEWYNKMRAERRGNRGKGICSR